MYLYKDKKDVLKFQGMCQVIALSLWVSFHLTLCVRVSNFSVRQCICVFQMDGGEKKVGRVNEFWQELIVFPKALFHTNSVSIDYF